MLVRSSETEVTEIVSSTSVEALLSLELEADWLAELALETLWLEELALDEAWLEKLSLDGSELETLGLEGSWPEELMLEMAWLWLLDCPPPLEHPAEKREMSSPRKNNFFFMDSS